MIQLENISIGYRPGKPLAREVNLAARQGELVALAGRNGTGKSTLLRSMLGLVPLLEGRCLYNGKPLAAMDPLSRARTISYVSSRLDTRTSLTARELVSLGRMPYTGWSGRPGSQDREHVERALDEVHMRHLAERGVETLSDGERQRIMIARAVAQDTPVMVLDEPAAFLDIPNKFELVRILSDYRDRGKIIIYSTHDLETAMMSADKFWVLEQGGIREGSPEDLGMQGVFDRMFASPDLRFELESGRFRHRKPSKGQVLLTGDEGAVFYWTRHALERIGYAVTRKEAGIRVRIETTTRATAWEVDTGSGAEKMDSLYLLARSLTQDD